MARRALKDPVVTVNGVAWPFVTSITISQNYQVNEHDEFGSPGKVRVDAGLSDNSLSITAVQGDGTAELDALITPILGSFATVVVQAAAGSVSTTNPSWTAECFVQEYMPIDGARGETVIPSMTWPVNGVWTRATS